jgi:hypothetical protein
MKTVKLKGGAGQIREPGDPQFVEPKFVASEDVLRLVASIATVERESPEVFAAELTKARAGIVSSASVAVEERPVDGFEP